MCQRLNELKTAMRAYATAFDPTRLSCADAAIVVKESAAIEHMAATIKALAAARAAQVPTWKADGHRSAEEALAQATGSSVSGARDALMLGRRLAEQPAVADAARRGELSASQASAISDAVAIDPKSANQLVGAATAGGSLADLRDQCTAVKAAAVDLEARRVAIHRRRRLRSWTDEGGEWHLVGCGNPEAGAQIMAALTPLVDQAFRTARREGGREHLDAYRFDALLQFALDATGIQAGGDNSSDVDRPGETNGPARNQLSGRSKHLRRNQLPGRSRHLGRNRRTGRSQQPRRNRHPGQSQQPGRSRGGATAAR